MKPSWLHRCFAGSENVPQEVRALRECLDRMSLLDMLNYKSEIFCCARMKDPNAAFRVIAAALRVEESRADRIWRRVLTRLELLPYYLDEASDEALREYLPDFWAWVTRLLCSAELTHGVLCLLFRKGVPAHQNLARLPPEHLHATPDALAAIRDAVDKWNSIPVATPIDGEDTSVATEESRQEVAKTLDILTRASKTVELRPGRVPDHPACPQCSATQGDYRMFRLGEKEVHKCQKCGYKDY